MRGLSLSLALWRQLEEDDVWQLRQTLKSKMQIEIKRQIWKGKVGSSNEIALLMNIVMMMMI